MIVRPVALMKGRVLIKDSFPIQPVTSCTSQPSTDRRTLHFFVLSETFPSKDWAQVSVCPTQILWEDLNHFTASSPLLASVRLSPWKPLHYSADTVQWQWRREHDGERERREKRAERRETLGDVSSNISFLPDRSRKLNVVCRVMQRPGCTRLTPDRCCVMDVFKVTQVTCCL